MKTISANINVMIMACEKASKSLIRDFGEIEKLQVSIKGPSDFVSSADKKVEKTLISELKKSRSNYSILSEEIGEIKSENSEYRWISKPSKGTLNYLQGIPHFAKSLA
jgi:myo-inositol-1(or 4)-monophosphatase